MDKVKVISQSAKETIQFGASLARKSKSGDIICLQGDLGTGKTTLVKGFAKALKVNPDEVHSPTFVLMNVYEGKRSIFHFDLYRLDHENEIIAIGYDEFLYGEGIAIIEWSEKLGSLQPKEYLQVELKHRKDEGRDITIKAVGAKYKRYISDK